jgi:D-arginine dehydrogenase
MQGAWMPETAEFIVIGAGIAGASAGYWLAPHGRVLLLEMESQPGYHTTGRSAAVFSEWYGNATINALTSGSKDFFLEPPPGFAEHPLLHRRGALLIGRQDQRASLDQAAADGREHVRRLDAEATLALCPMLRRDYVAGAVLEPDAADIDVNALHRGFLRGLADRGGQLRTEARATALRPCRAGWRVESTAGAFEAPLVLDAAGAWADEVAGLAGLAPLALVPKRRTAILFAAPAGYEIARWPAVIDVDEQFYFRPDAGKLMGSPADETPHPPADVQPDELDIAVAVDRIQRAAHVEIRRIEHRWAGLRTFAADKTPVAGFDAAAPGFFWFAGQGGYGIQTAPALGRLAASLVTGAGIPADLAARGLAEPALSPARFRKE